MKFDHPQLDPQLNRVMRVPGPASPARTHVPTVAQPDPDPKAPYLNVHVGLFHGAIEDENGKTVNYALYVPSTMKTSGRCGLVYLPGRVKADEFVNCHAWARILEKHEMSLFFIEALDGWHEEEPGWALDITAKMIVELHGMDYFPANSCNTYGFGFGDGAKALAMCAMFNVGVFAAVAAYGDCNVDPELVEYVGRLPSDGDKYVAKGDVNLPAYILDDDCTTVEYFKKACACRDENLINVDANARVWRQRHKPGELYINEQAVCEVWQTLKKDADAMDFDVVIDNMVGFAAMFGRWGGQDNWYMRKTITPETEGFILHEKEIDGLIRRWHMFEPSAYKQKRFEKYPLVIAIHGFSCSGPFFAENSEWHAVGEARDFFVCYPTAYPTSRSLMGGASITPTPTWNSGLVPRDDAPDEVSFFRQMVEEIKKEYPIDEERIYVAGHSNGSAMTQCLMRCAPELFAGFNPVGGMERGMNGEVVPEPDDGYIRPVWYFMSEFDRTGMELEDDGMNAMTVKNLCNANGIDYGTKRDYVNGIYHHHMAFNKDHAPLVRFTGVGRTPHTYGPEMSIMVWDEFFCRLRRHKDGSVTYIG